MQTALIHIDEGGEDKFPEIEVHLSFDRYLNHLKSRVKDEISIKKDFFESMINRIEQAFKENGPVNEDNFFKFQNELSIIYASLNPPLAAEEEKFWALGFPMGQKICFGTDAFYKLLQKNGCQTQSLISTPKHFEDAGFLAKSRMLYGFIVERLYGIDSSSNFELIHSFIDDLSGLTKYYRISIDHSFVEVKVIGELPLIDRVKVRDEFSKTLNLEIIKSLLPLDKFQLEGFSILKVYDITASQALENIKNIIIKGDEIHDAYKQVITSLRTFAGKPDIEFSLLPFLKLNGRVVFDSTKENASPLFELITSSKVTQDSIEGILDQFMESPEILHFDKDEVSEDNDSAFFLQGMRNFGIENYALLPVFHNKEIVGVMEVFSREKGVLDEKVLSKVFNAGGLLAQLLKDETVQFEAKLNEVIKNKFTSIQSAVQWKFNEEAWKYLQKIKQDQPEPTIGNISFGNVHPLYGAIDIRNSTIERNFAAYQDMVVHLELLENVLIQLKGLGHLVILDEMIFSCGRWLQEINEELMDSFQIQLNDFFNRDVAEVLVYFKENVNESQSIITDYEQAIDPISGVVFKNRHALERSIQLINTGISGYLDFFEQELQNSYPCYFEKFRSDGVEYDIYIGQSIAPDKKFNEVYLKNIRLWQLTSMAGIARITHSLLEQMERRLLTAQLIFVNAAPIDISFRIDERRFDVEGAYNIRYQIIKKRIDKVTIKGTEERLTQPGKIALVYFTPKDAKEYLGYIHYLQKNGTLLDDLENLELEELQGVKGLQALRVGVNLS